MVDSDVEMAQQSETWADSEMESEMGALTQAEAQELLDLISKHPQQPKATPKMQLDKQAKFEDESEEERKDEEDYNNEDHQASMATKMRLQSARQSSGTPSQVIVQSGSSSDQEEGAGEAQEGQRPQALAEEAPNTQNPPQAQPQPAQQPAP